MIEIKQKQLIILFVESQHLSKIDQRIHINHKIVAEISLFSCRITLLNNSPDYEVLIYILGSNIFL